MAGNILYTRCPRCNKELSFRRPENLEQFPDDYRYPINCPNCGCCIGVKLNKIDRSETSTPFEQPYNTDYDTDNDLPTLNQYNDDDDSNSSDADPKQNKNPNGKKSKTGLGRNIFMMILSLIFIAGAVVAYLISTGVIATSSYGLELFNGILSWELVVKHAAELKGLFGESVWMGMYTILPLIVFTMSCISFIGALVCAIIKKYSRLLNVLWSLIFFAVTILLYISPFMMLAEGVSFVVVFTYPIQLGMFLAYALPLLGFIQFLFSLIFLAPLNKKQK